MVKVRIYMEGGGDNNPLRSECRQGLSKFLEKAGLIKMPRIKACGGRDAAYRDYCNALKRGDEAILLVDSEGPIDSGHQSGDFANWRPWQHLKQRQGDGWDKPQRASDADCHLMVQTMESWFLADRQVLEGYYGQGFRANALPSANRPLEDVPKKNIQNGLDAATRACQSKSRYDKGRHSFDLLGRIDPMKVTGQSPWAKRFVGEVRKRMSP